MHTKAAIAKISKTRLVLALLSALTMLKISNPKDYNVLEAKLFKVKHVRSTKSRKKKRRFPKKVYKIGNEVVSKRHYEARKRGRKRPTKKQLAARRAFVRKFAKKK